MIPFAQRLLSIPAAIFYVVGYIEILDNLLAAKAPSHVLVIFGVGWCALGFVVFHHLARSMGE